MDPSPIHFCGKHCRILEQTLLSGHSPKSRTIVGHLDGRICSRKPPKLYPLRICLINSSYGRSKYNLRKTNIFTAISLTAIDDEAGMKFAWRLASTSLPIGKSVLIIIAGLYLCRWRRCPDDRTYSKTRVTWWISSPGPQQTLKLFIFNWTELCQNSSEFNYIVCAIAVSCPIAQLFCSIRPSFWASVLRS